MKINLKTMSRKELEKLGADVAKALKKVEGREMKAALAAAEKTAKSHGFSLAEITGAIGAAKPTRKANKAPKVKSAPKFANPDDAAQTWTGKGRRPTWFLDAVAAGKSPEDMAI